MPLSEFLLALQTLVLVATIKMPEMSTVTPIKVANPPSTPEMRGVRNVAFWGGLLGEGRVYLVEVSLKINSLEFCEGVGTGNGCSVLVVQLTHTAATQIVAFVTMQ